VTRAVLKSGEARHRADGERLREIAIASRRGNFDAINPNRKSQPSPWPSHVKRARSTETAFGAAFLRALLIWARREGRSSKRIALPSTVVDADELRQVIVALVCARVAA
jgi:hypothetical protein